MSVIVPIRHLHETARARHLRLVGLLVNSGRAKVDALVQHLRLVVLVHATTTRIHSVTIESLLLVLTLREHLGCLHEARSEA